MEDWFGCMLDLGLGGVCLEVVWGHCVGLLVVGRLVV